MEPLDCFSHLNFVLTFIGCRLCKSTSKAKLLNFAISICFWISNVSYFLKVFKEFRNDQSVLKQLFFPFHVAVSLVFKFYCDRKKEELCRLLEILVKELGLEDRRTLRKRSILSCLVWSVWCIFTLCGHLMMRFLHDELFRETLFEMVIECLLLFSRILQLNMMASSCAVYCFFVKALILTERLHFKRFFARIRSKKHTNMLEILGLKSLLQLKAKLDGTLNLFPFLWLGLLMMIGSGFVSSCDAQHGEKIVLWIYFGSQCFYPIISITWTDNQFGTIVNLAEKAIRDLLIDGKELSFEKYLLIQELESYQKRSRLTVWTFFPLEKNLLVSFVGALVSFSVLFLQMSTN